MPTNVVFVNLPFRLRSDFKKDCLFWLINLTYNSTIESILTWVLIQAKAKHIVVARVPTVVSDLSDELDLRFHSIRHDISKIEAFAGLDEMTN